MFKKQLKRFTTFLLTASLTLGTLSGLSDSAVARAETTDFDGSKVMSSGTESDAATINGDGITVEKDGDNHVLSFSGKEGTLEFPETVWDGAGQGFSVALRVRPDSSGKSTANIFQSNISGTGSGDTYWRDAPEISLNAGGKITCFVGGRTINGVYDNHETYNNGVGTDDRNYAEPGGHKVRYSASTKALATDSWNDVVLTISPTTITLTVNGTAQTLSADVSTYDLSSCLEYLFGTYSGGRYILEDYKFTSLGNSVYSDTPYFSGKIDDVKLYRHALSSSEIKNLPKADFDYDFEDISESGNITPSDLTKYIDGTSLTACEDLQLTSPDGKTKVELWKDSGNSYYYSVTRSGEVLVESSRLGFSVSGVDFTKGFTATTPTKKEINETYNLINGKKKQATDHCNESTITFTSASGSMDVVFRAYDDGVAYRYKNVTISGKENLTISKELSEIIFSDKAKTWAFDLNGTYEGEFVKRNNKTLTNLEKRFSTPLLAKNGGYWMLVSEAGVYNNESDYASSCLETEKNSKVLRFSFGLKRDPGKEARDDLASPGHLDITSLDIANNFTTPWRAIIISDNINSFVDSTIISNLNPDYDKTLFKDTSWIKPGKVAWSWWAEDTEQGNYDKHIEYIDFAAENGWDYVCIDVGWETLEGRLKELCDYAAKKNIGIFVWVNYRNITTTEKVDAAFKKWAAAGAKGIKADYFESDSPEVLDIMEYCAKKCAELKMMILYHGCVRPAGESRTYPNVLTMEAVQGEEWHKWFPYPTVANCLMYPFTRNILGSMDYTPAATLTGGNSATNGFALAQTVVYESGLQHFSNAVSNYKGYAGLSFLNRVPTTWDSTIVLEGEPGEYATFARQSGNDWYVGAMTASARTTEFSLDFLGSGEYNAYIYKDSSNGSRLEIETKKVTAKDTFSQKLPESGGIAVIFTKDTVDTSVKYADSADLEGYTYYEAESEDNTLNGNAIVSGAIFCSGAKKVGYVGLGSNNTLQFNKVKVEKNGQYEVVVYYCCAETRQMKLLVNGTDEYTMTGLNSSSWAKPAKASIKLSLKKGENTIKLSNASQYAPDIDRIAVADKTVDETVQNNSDGKKSESGSTSNSGSTANTENNNSASKSDDTAYTQNKNSGKTESVIGKTFVYKKAAYKITDKNTVTYIKTQKKKTASVTVPKTAIYQGKTYKITKIGANAFKNCKKLKKLTIKTATLKKVGKNALKGVNKKCRIKVPAKKYKKYKKLFKNKGQKKSVRVIR